MLAARNCSRWNQARCSEKLSHLELQETFRGSFLETVDRHRRACARKQHAIPLLVAELALILLPERILRLIHAGSVV